MEDRDRLAVGRFFAKARDLAGSGKELARLVAPWTGGTGARSTADAWAQGRNDPPAWLLFRLARHYRLSVDEYVSSEDRPASTEQRVVHLEERVEELRRSFAVLHDVVAADRADRGEPPIDFPQVDSHS